MTQLSPSSAQTLPDRPASRPLIPLIIHLSRSRRTKKMRFSTTRFFTDQFLRSYRMSRLKEVVPARLPHGPVRPAGHGPGPAVLSRPSGAVAAGGAAAGRAGRPRPRRLRQHGLRRRRRDAVRSGRRSPPTACSPASAAATPPASSWPAAGPTGRRCCSPSRPADLDEVRRAIAKRQVAALGTDLTAAIARAEELAVLGRGGGPVGGGLRLQRLAGERLGRSRPATPAQRPSDVVVCLRRRCGPPRPPINRAVTAVRYAATRPRVGMPFAVCGRCCRWGKRRQGRARCAWSSTAAKVGEQKRRAAARRQVGVRRASTTPSRRPAGTPATSRSTTTRLPIDNRRYFALEVPTQTQTVPVLAVNGAPSSVAHQDELFFLRLALTAAPEGQNGPFDIRAIAPARWPSTEVNELPAGRPGQRRASCPRPPSRSSKTTSTTAASCSSSSATGRAGVLQRRRWPGPTAATAAAARQIRGVTPPRTSATLPSSTTNTAPWRRSRSRSSARCSGRR